MKKRLAFAAGPLAFAAAAAGVDSAVPGQAAVLGLLCWMMIWWISEAVPMAVTSLLPILVLPLSGVLSLEATCAPYGDKYVFLFLGGFLLALAMEKWNLHRRIALHIIRRTGTNANRIIWGFMLASFAISMWISNTATALMMFPIATSVVALLIRDHHSGTPGEKHFATSIFLGIAYASSIGGIATLVGSPPNAAMAGILRENHGITVSFFDWFIVGFPFALLLLTATYGILVYIVHPNRLGRFEMGRELLGNELRSLGPWRSAEKRVFVVFAAAAVLWMAQEKIATWLAPVEFSDVTVSILAGLSLFLIPSGNRDSRTTLEWEDTARLPWGILLMFGGGLSLARGFRECGLVDRITGWIQLLDHGNPALFVIVLCITGLLLTALMSNLAMVNIFVPVVAGLAVALGKPAEWFAIPVAISSSCDFMFPMSTPPNAIAYSSGMIRARQMFRAGLWINLASLILLAALAFLLFGV